MPGRLLSGTRLWSGSGKSADFPRHPAPGAVGRRSTCQGGNPRRPARPTSAAKAENRQIFQDSGKYFLEHHFPQSVAVTRGQGQSPALESDVHANFRVTPHRPRGGRFRKSGRLEPALRHAIPCRELSGEAHHTTAGRLSPKAALLSAFPTSAAQRPPPLPNQASRDGTAYSSAGFPRGKAVPEGPPAPVRAGRSAARRR